MSGITVTAEGNKIRVNFNGLFAAGVIPYRETTFLKQNVTFVRLYDDRIEIKMNNNAGFWFIRHDATKMLDEDDPVLEVSAINTRSPTSLDDLYEKVVELLL